jgi:hypothetical protein
MSDDPEPPTYDLVRTRTQIAEAETQLAYIKLRQRTGELLDRGKVTRAMADMGHRHRDLLMNLPIRHANILAGDYGVNGRALLVALERMIYQELQEIAAEARARQGEAA